MKNNRFTNHYSGSSEAPEIWISSKSSAVSHHQLSNPPNSGSGLYLQESRDVHDDIPEDVILLLTVEPAEFSDSGMELNQSLSDKGGELRPCRQVV